MEINTAPDEAFTARGILDDPLMREFAPRNLNRGILEDQLYDQGLLHMDLDELAGMELEELMTRAFCDCIGMEQEPDAAAPAEEPAPGAQASGAEKGQSGVQVLVEGVGVEAKIVLSAPAAGEQPPDYDDLCRALRDHGVAEGIRGDFLARLAARPVYGHKFKIAMGSLPEDGEDGSVVFHFDTSVDLSPQIDEKGVADYKALDYVKNVKAGDLLCEIVPPTEGKDGFSVFGEVIPGKKGQPAMIKNGPNTLLAANGTQVLAACDGQVYLRNDKVGVSRVLLVDKVDASTGNILFVGTVQVRGDVAGGFTVRAGGDIVVRGIVEDAVLVAGGNIVLCGGMKGRDRGILDAGGSIRTLFIENAKVRSRDSLYADSIVNSTVECDRRVSISGRRGCLIGGTCRAGRTVSAMQVGNEANVATNICLQNIASFSEQRDRARLQVSQYRGTLERLRQIVEMAAESGWDDTAYQAVLIRVIIVKQRFERTIRRLESDFSDEESLSVTRTVTVRETLYPNTVIEIDGAFLRAQKPMTNCVAFRRQDRIHVTTAYY